MLIKSLEVNGFRSLKEFKADNFEPANVFFGLNNTGKSNILSFLEILFERKWQEDRQVKFWEGKIRNFADNFYKNEIHVISFKIHISIPTNYLKHKLQQYLSPFKGLLSATVNDIILEGDITAELNNEAYFQVKSVVLNTKYIFSFKNGEYTYNPSAEAVEALLTEFNDAVKVISSHRYMADEKEVIGTNDIEDSPSPTGFKNWLFKMSLNREKYNTFQNIKTWFNGDPFNYGNISLTKNGDNIDILIDNGGMVLPIGRYGSGVQQLLMLLSHIASCNSHIVGIEELEINLSPRLQKDVLKKILSFLSSETSPINQLFLVSHSEEFDVKEEKNIRKFYTTVSNGVTKVTDVTKAWPEPSKKEWKGTATPLWDVD